MEGAKMNTESDQSKMLFTGGSGLLGKNFHLLCPGINYPTSNEFDVTNYEQMEAYIKDKDISLVIHAAAFTSPPKINEDPAKAIEVNIIGTANVVKLCMEQQIKLIYISTDYVFRGDKGNYNELDEVYPVNKYAWSKLGGECAMQMYDNSLIIRTTFGPVPFPYDKAFVDQFTSRQSVIEITEKIATLIDADITATIHVGGPRRTVYEYAKSLGLSKEIGEKLD